MCTALVKAPRFVQNQSTTYVYKKQKIGEAFTLLAGHFVSFRSCAWSSEHGRHGRLASLSRHSKQPVLMINGTGVDSWSCWTQQWIAALFGSLHYFNPPPPAHVYDGWFRYLWLITQTMEQKGGVKRDGREGLMKTTDLCLPILLCWRC